MRRPLCLAVLAACAAPARAEIPVVELRGAVHAVSAEHVVAALHGADASGAPLVVVQMDTPGGLDTAMRQIVDAMLNGRTPVAVWVGPSGARAASAGFVIAIAADVAAMAPGTNLGAAHPVSGLGGQMDEVMSTQVTSDAAAYVRGKAERRGRNPALAEKAVTESLSFTEKEALEAKLIEHVVPDVGALLRALDGREITRFDGSKTRLALSGHAPVSVPMSWRQGVLSLLARPDVMFLLLLGALAGLGTEISHPGLIFPGVVGALCLVLFLFASQVLPVNAAGVVLVLLAVVLFALEVKVASYGLLTVGGIVAMILGALMLVDAQAPELRVSPLSLLVPVLAMAAWTITLVRLVLRSQKRRASTGAEALVGQRGRAEEALAPRGFVLVHGERWSALAESAVERGAEVVVTGVEGLLLRVRKEES